MICFFGNGINQVHHSIYSITGYVYDDHDVYSTGCIPNNHDVYFSTGCNHGDLGVYFSTGCNHGDLGVYFSTGCNHGDHGVLGLCHGNHHPSHFSSDFLCWSSLGRVFLLHKSRYCRSLEHLAFQLCQIPSRIWLPEQHQSWDLPSNTEKIKFCYVQSYTFSHERMHLASSRKIMVYDFVYFCLCPITELNITSDYLKTLFTLTRTSRYASYQN